MFLERPYRSLRVDLFLFSGVPSTPLWITTCWSIVIFGCFFDAPVDHYLLICLTFLWGLNLEDIWRLLPDVSLTKCNSVTCTRIDEKAAWGFDPNVGGGPVTPDVSNVYKRGRRTCDRCSLNLQDVWGFPWLSGHDRRSADADAPCVKGVWNNNNRPAPALFLTVVYKFSLCGLLGSVVFNNILVQLVQHELQVAVTSSLNCYNTLPKLL